MPEPLNRKFDDHFNACAVGQQVAMSLAHVEPDCVKAWARMNALGRTDSLARDLGLTLQDAAARHERMTARDENKTTKLRRFQRGA